MNPCFRCCATFIYFYKAEGTREAGRREAVARKVAGLDLWLRKLNTVLVTGESAAGGGSVACLCARLDGSAAPQSCRQVTGCNWYQLAAADQRPPRSPQTSARLRACFTPAPGTEAWASGKRVKGWSARGPGGTYGSSSHASSVGEM